MAVDKIFIDTDVIIDFLINREPFSKDAAKLFTYAERALLEINVSSLSFSNIYYVVRRLKNSGKARQLLNQLESLTTILAVDHGIIKQALISKFSDFEDGIQNYCAKNGGVMIIVTRNIKDYSKSELAVHTPNSYLKIFEEKMKNE